MSIHINFSERASLTFAEYQSRCIILRRQGNLDSKDQDVADGFFALLQQQQHHVFIFTFLLHPRCSFPTFVPSRGSAVLPPTCRSLLQVYHWFFQLFTLTQVSVAISVWSDTTVIISDITQVRLGPTKNRRDFRSRNFYRPDAIFLPPTTVTVHWWASARSDRGIAIQDKLSSVTRLWDKVLSVKILDERSPHHRCDSELTVRRRQLNDTLLSRHWPWLEYQLPRLTHTHKQTYWHLCIIHQTKKTNSFNGP